jgi:hypothetical protein
MSAIRSIDAVAAFRALGFSIEVVSAERVVLVRAGRRVVVPRHRDLTPHDVELLVLAGHVSQTRFDEALATRPGSGTHRRVDPSQITSADAAPAPAAERHK